MHPYCCHLGLTDKRNSRFGKQFSRLLLRVHVQRSSEFYLTNVALILFGRQQPLRGPRGCSIRK